MLLNDYLSVNRSAIDIVVTSLAERLATEDDTDRDRRLMARDTSKALQEALKSLLEGDFTGGMHLGVSEDVCVVIPESSPSHDIVGKFLVRAGLLTYTSNIPMSADWFGDRPELDSSADAALFMMSRPQMSSKVVTVSPSGSIDLGSSQAGRQYMLEELPGGELWLKPLEEDVAEVD